MTDWNHLDNIGFEIHHYFLLAFEKLRLQSSNQGLNVWRFFIGPYLSAFASLATPQHVCQLKSVPQTILMRVHVLSAVQTKHGGEFGQKAAQERNKSGKPASGSSLMAELPTITYQAVIRAVLIFQTWWQRLATGREGGEATQLHRQWASRSWHHQSPVLRSVLITITAATKWD